MFAPGGGEPPTSDGADLVAAARSVAQEVLFPAAQDVDQAASVPETHLRALAEAGLFGLLAPPEYGGRAAPPSIVRRVFETLAGACGVTFFVWVQHHAPVRLLSASPNGPLRDRLLPDLSTGRMVGGVAFAHLRRPGPPAVLASPVAGGFVLRGEAPWATAWGIVHTYAVAAVVEGDEDRVTFVAVDAGHLVPSAPLRLVAMNASSTVRLGFDDLFVPEDDVIVEVALPAWRIEDRLQTARPNPPAFGVAATALRLLAERDAPAAALLDHQWAVLRDESYALADEGSTDDVSLARMVDLRAASLDLAWRAAHALVTATGGRAMELSHPAQRLLREAAFYAIQAQTAELRQATLARLIAPQPGSS